MRRRSGRLMKPPSIEARDEKQDAERIEDMVHVEAVTGPFMVPHPGDACRPGCRRTS